MQASREVDCSTEGMGAPGRQLERCDPCTHQQPSPELCSPPEAGDVMQQLCDVLKVKDLCWHAQINRLPPTRQTAFWGTPPGVWGSTCPPASCLGFENQQQESTLQPCQRSLWNSRRLQQPLHRERSQLCRQKFCKAQIRCSTAGNRLPRRLQRGLVHAQLTTKTPLR